MNESSQKSKTASKGSKHTSSLHTQISKRPPPISLTSWDRRRCKPKRLKLVDVVETSSQLSEFKPPTSNQEQGETSKISNDVYEFDQWEFYKSIHLRPQERPLPSVSALLAIARQQQQRDGSSHDPNTRQSIRHRSEPNASNVPILKDFFKSLRKSVLNNNEQDEEGSQNDDLMMIENEMDATSDNQQYQNDLSLDQCSAIVTHGHHKRFKELLLELEKDGLSHYDKQRKRKSFRNKIARHKEFLRLCQLFGVERQMYAAAMAKFQIDNAKRFLIGFRSKFVFVFVCMFCAFCVSCCLKKLSNNKVSGPASNFVNANAEKAKQWKERWENAERRKLVSNLFGPCTQQISLQDSAKAFEFIGVEMFDPRIIYRDLSGLPKLSTDWMESMKEKELKPCISMNHDPKLLCEDELAKTFALEHGVDIVSTSCSFEALFRNPDEQHGKWNIPLAYVNVNNNERTQKLVLFMEDALPSASTPRQCLSAGIQEALIQSAAESLDDTIKGKAVYTLLTIPCTTKKLKILIRSFVRLLDPYSRPVSLQCHLDYFLEERGLEEFTVYERLQWLLHKITQGDSNTAVVRVDPNVMKIVIIEEKTVADAITPSRSSLSESYLDSLGSFESSNDLDIGYFFTSMSTILSAVLLIKKKPGMQHMICRTSKGTVICRSSIERSRSVDDFNIHDNIDRNGTAVILNQNYLLSCFRPWKWTSNRLPFTFKLRESDEYNISR